MGFENEIVLHLLTNNVDKVLIIHSNVVVFILRMFARKPHLRLIFATENVISKTFFPETETFSPRLLVPFLRIPLKEKFQIC